MDSRFSPALARNGSAAYTLRLGSDAAVNVAALNAALLTNAWVVVSKPGTYEFNTSILIPSNSRLSILPGVTIKLAASSFTYLFRNYGTNGAIGTWTAGNTNITIDGGGTIDLNSINNAQAPASINVSISNWPSMGMYFINCSNIKVQNLAINGTPYNHTARVNKYCLYFTGGNNILCEDLTIVNTSDGIHFHGEQYNIKCKNIQLWTNDDGIGVTPSNGGYSTYTPSGTDGNLNGIWIENVRQNATGTCLLLYGYPGAELNNATVKNLWSKPIAPVYTNPADTFLNVNTNPVFRFTGVHNLNCDGVFGWMPRTSAPILGVYDATESATVRPCNNIKIKNLVRKDRDAINTIPAGGDSCGRLFTANPEWKCNDLEIDGFASYQNDGTEGFVFNNGSSVFNLSQPHGTGWVTHFTARNGRVSSINPADWAVRTTGYMIFSGTGLNYDGTSWVGTTRIEDCQIKSLQYLSVPTDSALTTLRYLVANNTFSGLDRGVRFLNAGAATFTNNHYIGTTTRIIELGSTNASATVDLRFDSSNYGMGLATQLYSSTALSADASPNKIWLYTLKSCWRPRGRGAIQTVDSNRYGAWDSDVFRLTANSAQTLRLRQFAPGDIITIRNDSASGTITLSTVTETGSAQNTADATQRNGTFTNTAGTALTNPMTTGQAVTLIATSERDWQQIG